MFVYFQLIHKKLSELLRCRFKNCDVLELRALVRLELKHSQSLQTDHLSWDKVQLK